MPPPPELSRPIPLSRLGAQPLSLHVLAGHDENQLIAARLRIPAVGALRAEFTLRRLPGGVIEATGLLAATVTQECVVSLEPFDQDVTDEFTVRFVPDSRDETTRDDTDELLDPDSIDEIPYEGDRIDIGEATVEQLALALDPFPRKPGVALSPTVANEPDPPDPTATIHPFAVLRARRDRG
jgi:uncharacterized metal-binding protein YceD (DUF177 family)